MTYLELAKRWWEENYSSYGYDDGGEIAYGFASFLDQEHKEECDPHREVCGDQCTNLLHKPQEHKEECCDVCRGYCRRGFCPCHKPQEKPVYQSNAPKSYKGCACLGECSCKPVCEHEAYGTVGSDDTLKCADCGKVLGTVKPTVPCEHEWKDCPGGGYIECVKCGWLCGKPPVPVIEELVSNPNMDGINILLIMKLNEVIKAVNKLNQ